MPGSVRRFERGPAAQTRVAGVRSEVRAREIMMDLGLRDRVALITGGSAGIGLATARAFLAEGARVAICARGAERLAAAAATLGALPGARVLARPVDVLQAEQVRAWVEAAVAEFGRVDVLVNNA